MHKWETGQDLSSSPKILFHSLQNYFCAIFCLWGIKVGPLSQFVQFIKLKHKCSVERLTGKWDHGRSLFVWLPKLLYLRNVHILLFLCSFWKVMMADHQKHLLIFMFERNAFSDQCWSSEGCFKAGIVWKSLCSILFHAKSLNSWWHEGTNKADTHIQWEKALFR